MILQNPKQLLSPHKDKDPTPNKERGKLDIPVARQTKKKHASYPIAPRGF